MSDRPNVIVFFTDQQRWDTAGIHGNPAGLTPNFDRFAARGTHLAHTFTCQPVCGPARSCLQTGLYATETGVFRNAITLDPALPTLPDHFHGAGYATGYIGKWHLGPRERIGPVAPEHRARYDYWLASNVLEYTSDAYRTTLYDGDEQPVELPGYRVDALADAAIRYLDGRDGGPRDRPFFLFLSFIEPHHQNHRDDYPAPDGYEERYTGAWVPPDLAALGGSAQQHLPGYYGIVKRLDEAFGGCWTRSAAWEWPTTPWCCTPPTTATTSRPATASTSAPATSRRSASRPPWAAPASTAAAESRSWSA